MWAINKNNRSFKWTQSSFYSVVYMILFRRKSFLTKTCKSPLKLSPGWPITLKEYSCKRVFIVFYVCRRWMNLAGSIFISSVFPTRFFCPIRFSFTKTHRLAPFSLTYTVLIYLWSSWSGLCKLTGAHKLTKSQYKETIKQNLHGRLRKHEQEENLRGTNFLKIQTVGQLRQRIPVAKGCSF